MSKSLSNNMKKWKIFLRYHKHPHIVDEWVIDYIIHRSTDHSNWISHRCGVIDKETKEWVCKIFPQLYGFSFRIDDIVAMQEVEN